jgi:hypothetical protein
MNLMQRLPTLGNKRPITIVGAAVIDVIADAYALPGEAVILNCNSKASILAAVP